MTTHGPTTRPSRGVAVAVTVLAVVLSACGAGEEHNDADVAFATGMIPHHAQAVEMAAMVEGEDVDPAVADLAEEIAAAQEPEIEMLSAWLEEWGEPVPDSGSMAGMDMEGTEGMEMEGMMTAEEMSSLETAEGEELQRLWLELMVEHHRGAVVMAETEQADGENDEAVALAQEIEDTQAAEITVMEELLAQG